MSDPLGLGDLRNGDIRGSKYLYKVNIDKEYQTDEDHSDAKEREEDILGFFTPRGPTRLLDYEDISASMKGDESRTDQEIDSWVEHQYEYIASDHRDNSRTPNSMGNAGLEFNSHNS